ncbi:MAG: hypothetical protein FJZ87_01040 [Chloroflexi bacterium]|nr:hypothetical protein [Chloroflexota bacterium]
MLIFQSEGLIDQWCKRNNQQRGEILSVAQVWQLSKLWYHNRLSEEFHGRSNDQAAAIFRQAGLTSSFWYV